MKYTIHQGYIKASYFIFGCAFAGLIRIIFFPISWVNDNIWILVFNFSFYILLGLLVRKGFYWVRYLLFAMIFFIGLTFLSNDSLMVTGVYPRYNVHSIIGFLQIGLILCATWFVVKVPEGTK